MNDHLYELYCIGDDVYFMISFKSSYGYNFALSVFMPQNVRFYNVGVWNSVKIFTITISFINCKKSH